MDGYNTCSKCGVVIGTLARCGLCYCCEKRLESSESLVPDSRLVKRPTVYAPHPFVMTMALLFVSAFVVAMILLWNIEDGKQDKQEKQALTIREIQAHFAHDRGPFQGWDLRQNAYILEAPDDTYAIVDVATGEALKEYRRATGSIPRIKLRWLPSPIQKGCVAP